MINPQTPENPESRPRSASGAAKPAPRRGQSEAQCACVPTGAGLRFIQRTYLDGATQTPPNITVRATLYDYGNDLAEVGWSVVLPPKKQKPRGSGNREENQQRASRRAAATIRRKCMAMHADRLLTLTTAENITDVAMAWENWQKFARAMREHYGEFKYIVIPERQTRGAVHFHCAIKGFYPVNDVRAIWRSIVGPGNIDITSPRTGGQWSTQKLANYLTKYITKTLSDGEALAQLGSHRFRASLGIELVKIIRTFTGLEAEHKLLLWLSEVGGTVGYIWKKDEKYMCGWACSWG